MSSVALLAGIVVYAAADARRLAALVTAVGALGVAVAVVGLIRPWPSVITAGIAGVGAAYAVELAVGPQVVDEWAPLVAAALFAAAELAFWSAEPSAAAGERAVVIRRLVFLAASILVVVLVGSLLLYATSGTSGGIGFEALGVAAAVAALAVVAVLARRARELG